MITLCNMSMFWFGFISTNGKSSSVTNDNDGNNAEDKTADSYSNSEPAVDENNPHVVASDGTVSENAHADDLDYQNTDAMDI